MTLNMIDTIEFTAALRATDYYAAVIDEVDSDDGYLAPHTVAFHDSGRTAYRLLETMEQVHQDFAEEFRTAHRYFSRYFYVLPVDVDRGGDIPNGGGLVTFDADTGRIEEIVESDYNPRPEALPNSVLIGMAVLIDRFQKGSS